MQYLSHVAFMSMDWEIRVSEFHCRVHEGEQTSFRTCSKIAGMKPMASADLIEMIRLKIFFE